MSDQPHPQLTLKLSGVPDFDFDSFYSPGNEQLLHRLQALASGADNSSFYLWGAAAAGKSHLLQAVCLQAQQSGIACLFLAGRELQSMYPAVLQDMGSVQIICLDDVDHLLLHREWEEQLFHLHNRQRDAGNSLVVSAQQPLRQLPVTLADLKSRFAAMENYQIQLLTDDDKRAVLQRAALSRGFALADDVAGYILQHSSRDLVSLQKVLNRLDQQSLTEQRLITLPFVKKVMGW